MKKLLLGLTLLLSFSLAGCKEEENKIVICGEEGDNTTMTFNSDGIVSVIMESEGEQMDLGEIMDFDNQLSELNQTAEEYVDSMIKNFASIGITCTGNYESDIFDTYVDETFTERTSILSEAIAVENAAKLYCLQETCGTTETLTWEQVSPYVRINEENYDFENNSGIVATASYNIWLIDLERVGTGDFEFTENLTPSEEDIDAVIIDVD